MLQSRCCSNGGADRILGRLYTRLPGRLDTGVSDMALLIEIILLIGAAASGILYVRRGAKNDAKVKDARHARKISDRAARSERLPDDGGGYRD